MTIKIWGEIKINVKNIKINVKNIKINVKNIKINVKNKVNHKVLRFAQDDNLK